MAYIIRRGAFYYLNLRLPKHLFPSCHTLRLSLNISTRQPATFLASSLAQRVHHYLTEHPTADLEMLRLLCSQWRDTSPTPSVPERPSGSTEPQKLRRKGGPTLAELAKKYIKEGKAGGTWREVSTHEVERSLRDLFELMGDMPAEAFDVHQARLLKDRLSRCPQYFALLPQFKGKTLAEVIEAGGTYKTITAVTVNNRLRKLSAFMNWCKSNGYVAENPLMGLKAMVGSAKEARLSFESADLKILLNLDALKAEARKHPWRYWLPLLGRFTGARLEELCQLHITDFITLQGVNCIRIDDSHEYQKLKNSSSRRTLPIHPALIALGLLDYVQIQRTQSSDRLFPELEPVRGKLGHAPSKWFSRYRIKMGITDPKKTFHSFRHTFIDDLREAQVQDSLIKRTVGHEDSAVTFGVYGSRIPIKAMVEAIQHLRFER
ncbi:site-specific integrase [Pseudomonas rhodesiae]|uniref:Site-specific integrase n=1 Tax=Pseudomonas rhodesiae TaxID=76760 RepID=A0A8I1E1I8_9PSED|nr:site-specific integrase [Pseudomonas rhodesiae]MBI6623491.1 site-specific integrase [Pseudomonas rhodesiae]